MTIVNPPRSNSSANLQQTELQSDSRNAALFGALSAFAQPPNKPKSAVSQYAASNGALAAGYKAAITSSTTQPSFSRSPLSRQNTGASQTSTHSTSSPPAKSGKPTTSEALPASAGRVPLSRSPSTIAASLAAARHTPQAVASSQMLPGLSNGPPAVSGSDMPPVGTVDNAKARLNGPGKSRDRAEGEVTRNIKKDVPTPGEGNGATDDTPIAPTTSLVQLFERSSGAKAQPSESKHVRRIQELSSSTESPSTSRPTPVRSASALAKSSSPGSAPTSPRPPNSLHSTPDRGNATTRSMALSSSSAAAKPVESLKRVGSAATLPALRSPSTTDEQSGKAKPTVPPPRRAKKEGLKPDEDAASDTARTEPRFTAALLQSPPQDPLRPNKATLAPPEPLARPVFPGSSAYQEHSLRQISPHMTGDSLANAIVGAALASSRGPSPFKTDAPPPLPERRHHLSHHHKSHHSHHHPTLHRSHSHSPPKAKPGTLRRTLREPESSSSSNEDEKYRKGKGLMRRKHPNKHHEGDRKRWRNRVTERERKRYEGVWAANKGLYIPDQATEDDVLNIVVRDIWSRSRLPGHVLEEVWNLVDTRVVGRLGREEFVVGLWLIDQVLKGRKLPPKVSESVWQSVKYAGIKVKLKT